MRLYVYVSSFGENESLDLDSQLCATHTHSNARSTANYYYIELRQWPKTFYGNCRKHIISSSEDETEARRAGIWWI